MKNKYLAVLVLKMSDISSNIRRNSHTFSEDPAAATTEDELKDTEISGKTSKEIADWILQIRGPLTRFMFADFIGYDLTNRGFHKFLEIKSMPANTRFIITKELVEYMGYGGERILSNFEYTQCRSNNKCVLIDKTDEFFIENRHLHTFAKNKMSFYTCLQPQLITFFTSAETSIG